MFTKADKGKAISAINKIDCISKTVDFMTSGNFTVYKQQQILRRKRYQKC